MKHLLVTFKYESQLTSGTSHNFTNGELMKEILELLRAEGVAMLNWEPTHGLEFDHPGNIDESVLENHTLMEVRVEIHNPEHPEEAIDWHDGGDDLFHYVLDALELGEPEIMYFYTIGEAPMQKSIIGIDIHPAY